MASKKLLITGGTGFIGSALSIRLLDRGNIALLIIIMTIMIPLKKSLLDVGANILEYILTIGLPIFVVTEKGSATWSICDSLPQATMIDIAANTSGSAENENNGFYEKTGFSVPSDYSEPELALQFKAFVTS